MCLRYERSAGNSEGACLGASHYPLVQAQPFTPLSPPPTTTTTSGRTGLLRTALTRRQRLLQLVGLFGVMDDQCVQVATASHLELDVRLRLHDLDGCAREAIYSTACQQHASLLGPPSRVRLIVCLAGARRGVGNLSRPGPGNRRHQERHREPAPRHECRWLCCWQPRACGESMRYIGGARTCPLAHRLGTACANGLCKARRAFALGPFCAEQLRDLHLASFLRAVRRKSLIS